MKYVKLAENAHHCHHAHVDLSVCCSVYMMLRFSVQHITFVYVQLVEFAAISCDLISVVSDTM